MAVTYTVGDTRRATAKADPSPGDVGRFTLHAIPEQFATDLVTWCGDDVELNDVATWFEVVARELRFARELL